MLHNKIKDYEKELLLNTSLKGGETESKFHGYLTVIGGMIVHLYVGNIYLWGNIGPYVVSHYSGLGDVSATIKNAICVIPVCLCLIALANPVGCLALKTVHPKLVMAVGSAIGLVGLFIASLMTSWWLFLVFYAGMMPVSWGLLYSVPVILSWEWFPERKGLISGLIIGAHGFASFISSFIATAIVNPKN